MPWQQLVADIGLELLPGTSIPAYREVVVTVPRQNGKTTLTLAFEVQRGLGWGVPQQIAYTAQTGKDAREKLLNDQAPLLEAKTSPVSGAIKRVFKGVGNESVLFKSGSRIFILNSGEDSGHGKVIDLGVIDESFADADDRREQAMLPAMLTRPSAQILNISTAGHEGSVFLKRKVDAGRAAVTEGVTQGIAYFEWSAPEDLAIDDPATWWGCMPALGITITEAVVRHALLTMSEGEFRRAMLNQWTVSEERVIPSSLWNDACSEDVAPEGRMVAGLDISADRAWSSISMADDSARIELVRRSEGVGWVVDAVVELCTKWDTDVVIDSYGPAGSLISEIEAKGVTVHAYASRDMARACAGIYDAVADHKVKIRRHPDLDAAAKAVTKRSMGDTWTWARTDGADDVSPLIAATIAFDKATAASEPEPWFDFN